MRLQKYLAQAGVASRRKAEEMILQGQVAINGEIVTELGIKVNPRDKVTVNGKEISLVDKLIYLLLNKPAGVLCTVQDPHGRPTVLDIISSKWERYRLFPVGRLDYDTEGLIILTNDGDLTYRLTHPRFQVPKTYLALVQGKVTSDQVEQLRHGVPLDDGLTWPADVKLLGYEGTTSLLKLVLSEGRKRQVKRMCEYIGHPVLKLVRIAFGGLTLQGLDVSEYRLLTEQEVVNLKQLARKGLENGKNQGNPRSNNGKS